MHEPVKESLEDYLWAPDRRSLPQVDAHLEACQPCRATVDRMRRQAVLLQSLRSPDQAEPGVGFYARVLDRIDSQRRASIWAIFLDPFGKRLTYASAVLLVLLGGYIYTLESDTGTTLASTTEQILVDDQNRPQIDADQQSGRDAVLVNLATFEEQPDADSGPAVASYQ